MITETQRIGAWKAIAARFENAAAADDATLRMRRVGEGRGMREMLETLDTTAPAACSMCGRKKPRKPRRKVV